MSKYNPLWEHIANCKDNELLLTYDEIEQILGFPIDHSFLTYKKDLLDFGWQVQKISIKNKTVSFSKIK